LCRPRCVIATASLLVGLKMLAVWSGLCALRHVNVDMLRLLTGVLNNPSVDTAPLPAQAAGGICD